MISLERRCYGSFAASSSHSSLFRKLRPRPISELRLRDPQAHHVIAPFAPVLNVQVREMDEPSPSSSVHNEHASPSTPTTSTPRLTLTIPSLRSIALAKGLNKKQKGARSHGSPTPTPKAPRPVKLKPLKEVLSRLITLIKRFVTLPEPHIGTLTRCSIRIARKRLGKMTMHSS